MGAHSSHDRPDEQPIAALVPPAVRRAPPPVPMMLPRLPSPRVPPQDADPDTLLLDIAHLDPSGRFTTKALLNSLGWQPETGSSWPSPTKR